MRTNRTVNDFASFHLYVTKFISNVNESFISLKQLFTAAVLQFKKDIPQKRQLVLTKTPTEKLFHHKE